MVTEVCELTVFGQLSVTLYYVCTDDFSKSEVAAINRFARRMVWSMNREPRIVGRLPWQRRLGFSIRLLESGLHLFEERVNGDA